LAVWFEGIHCFVSAAKCEGWGLCQQTSMNIGRPLISIWYGGLREFWNRDTGYEIPYRLRPAMLAYKGCGLWAEPDRDAIIAAMRDVYENKSKAMQLGALASRSVQRFTIRASNKRLVGVLREFGVLPKERIEQGMGV